MGETLESWPQPVNGVFGVASMAIRTIRAQAAAYQCNDAPRPTPHQPLKPLKIGVFASWHNLCKAEPRRIITT
jgi:hypothetical protein